MSAPAETRELAYQVWRECGQNLSEAVRIMNGTHGYVISRQSMHEWKTKYDWEGRAARAEAESEKLKSATSDEALLDSLLKQKKKYESYFDSLEAGKIDNQAVYAYSGLLKTIIDVRQETGGFKAEVFGRFFRDLVEFLQANDPEAADAVMRNFDDFAAFVREKYIK